LRHGGQTVAGGALRRYDDETAEVKRMWTSHEHRRQGLGRRVLDELEVAARDLGYRRLYLTTGPRQPEAAALYLAAGFEPQFDVNADPESIGPLPFSKKLAVSLQVAS
jgi:GNAT superfamily N-acetyltransferase